MALLVEKTTQVVSSTRSMTFRRPRSVGAPATSSPPRTTPLPLLPVTVSSSSPGRGRPSKSTGGAPSVPSTGSPLKQGLLVDFSDAKLNEVLKSNNLDVEQTKFEEKKKLEEQDFSRLKKEKADLLVKYGGVAPKMTEEAHSQVIDQEVAEVACGGAARKLPRRATVIEEVSVSTVELGQWAHKGPTQKYKRRAMTSAKVSSKE
ncbi:hypothetical protein JHK82_028005 [Glycine max]|nr:hypothetical protein JHK82_028005 [Glycine max]